MILRLAVLFLDLRGGGSEQQESIHRPISVEVNGSELILVLRGSMTDFKLFQYKLTVSEISAAIKSAWWSSLVSWRFEARRRVRSLILNYRKSSFARKP